ncbi:MAG: DMT family transporter [Parachlamydiales bacterium]|nr:DMT family transporter [Parachlamydiales bacterium]
MTPKDIKLQPTNIKKACTLMLLAALSFSCMGVFVKMASQTTSNNMIILFRFAISSIYIWSIFGVRALKKQKLHIKTKHVYLHIFRALNSFFAMLFFYYSLKYISLVEGNLLILTNPLFIPIIAVIFMKIKTNIKHWVAIVIGFLGVILVLRPGFSIFNFYSLYALAAGLFVAITFIFIRKISHYDHHHTSMLYYFTIAFLLSLFVSIFEWKPLDLKTYLILLGTGFFGTFYQEFLIRASSYAPSRINSSLMYTSLIFSTIFSIIFFKQTPDFITWMGIFLVLIGSLLTIKAAKKII